MQSTPASRARRATATLGYALTATTVLFLLIMPFTSSAAVRNVTLGMALLCTVLVFRNSRSALPVVPRALAYSFAAWALWCAASWSWSIDPVYTARELRHEILRPVLVFGIFFVAANHHTYRLWTGTLMFGVVLLGALAFGELLWTGVWNPDRWHAGVGAYSTWLLMVFPLALALMLPRKAMLFDLEALRWPVFLLVVASIMGGAYLTSNRIVWLAFAVALAVFSLYFLVARWGFVRERSRLLAVGGALLVAQLLVFGIVTLDKARTFHGTPHPIESALADDARIKLWAYVATRIAEAPIAGHGFGRGILLRDLRGNFNDETLWHAHNIVLNALLETGIVGLVALLAVMSALALRYFAYVRTRRIEVAALGIIGLAFLAGFVVKNMTDDFLVRHTGLLFWSLNGMLIGLGERMLAGGASHANVPPILPARDSVAA